MTLIGRRASVELAEAIGTLGVWDAGLCFAPADEAREAARAYEDAGYTAAWLHESGGDAFVLAAVLLAATGRLVVGTSIVSIWQHEPARMAAAARTLAEAFPGRFVLGIGNSHHGAASWHGRGYDRPVADLSDYLDAMDAARYQGARPETPVPRMIAALGPRMLELARRRSRGAIPYLVPVEHTRFARATLGPDPVLAVHQAIVLGETDDRSRSLAHTYVARYLMWPNYRNNLLRCGFSADDLAGEGSDELVRALVAWGDADEVDQRIRAHLEAGADHVCVLPLDGLETTVPVAALRELARRMLPSGGREGA